MKRRRIIIGGGLLALVGSVAWVVWLCRPHPCRAAFEKVREGMTFEEVCATVGGPPGNYSSRPPLKEIATGGVRWTSHRWTAEDGTLTVVFDERSDGVAYVNITDPLPDNRTLLQLLRDRLGF
jgi:hypothetical protein